MVVEQTIHPVTQEVAYWLKNQEGQTPASAVLHPNFLPLVKPGALFLDVGCGNGRITRQIYGLGAKVIGFDPNIKELDFARRQSPNILYVQAYGEQPPFLRGKFDGAVILGVLGSVNLNTRERIVNETFNLLREGGFLYVAEFALITDPHLSTFHGRQRWVDVYEQDRVVTGEYGSVVVHNQTDWSVRFIAHHFTDEEISNLLNNVGIRVIASERSTIKSDVSGQLRDNLNTWGYKH